MCTRVKFFLILWNLNWGAGVCFFFLLQSELFFIISKSNYVRWLHGFKCEYRVEKKQENRA